MWSMRGTLHLLSSAELGVWLRPLGTYTNRGNTGHAETNVLAEAVGRAVDGSVDLCVARSRRLSANVRRCLCLLR